MEIRWGPPFGPCRNSRIINKFTGQMIYHYTTGIMTANRKRVKVRYRKREADLIGSRKGKDYMFTVNCLTKSYNEHSSYALLQHSEQGYCVVRSYEIGNRQNTVISDIGIPR